MRGQKELVFAARLDNVKVCSYRAMESVVLRVYVILLVCQTISSMLICLSTSSRRDQHCQVEVSPQGVLQSNVLCLCTWSGVYAYC